MEKNEKLSMIESRSVTEKEYEEIIHSLEVQIEKLKKSKEEKTNDSFPKLKNEIEMYFYNITIGLIEMGDIQNEEVLFLLKEERKKFNKILDECENPKTLKKQK